MPRTPKGEVSILNKDGMIQLYWRYQGDRKYLSLGLQYDPINIEVAKRRASQIKLDMLSGHFDKTLDRYRSDRPPSEGLGAVELFEKFIEWKAQRVQPRTLDKYRGLVTWLREFFGNRTADEDSATEFLGWLQENMEPITVRERLVLLRAGWKWGLDKELVSSNPWADLHVRKPPKQPTKPFTKDEVRRILEGFENSRYYSYYIDYVRFRFRTGFRSGEINGLRWRHFNSDCSVVWIGESHTHGEFKDTKTGKAREVKLSVSLVGMLRSQLEKLKPDPDELVFPAPKGGPIHEGNFAKRAWKTVLEDAGIEYRKPYNTRHTFISHALEAGMSPMEVAKITGHDVRTLYEDYAGLIKSHPTTPELF
ncbi:tyrosine-type recombinase/integrase [Leptothoe spongobia]|uniref:Tyrosine-type recombinase/integrase n=1 Tax=Leptothoe spongobia TAU-MAC 1115 TaxID=1967444 RepID=A0A947GSQ2_9CYAN|nr:tyrosine-type recombinase/integrase [Leptothoe spongobia]MBT9318041.1 tyrosine-type recombinase/integrase [Leptothoe spongobia TAU-MAC 1115]